MKPVKGTVARGYLPYAYPNTPEGYEQAGLNLHNPFSKLTENNGKKTVKYCIR